MTKACALNIARMAAGTRGTTPHSTRLGGTSKTPTEGGQGRKSRGKATKGTKVTMAAPASTATAQDQGKGEGKPPRVRVMDQRASPIHVSHDFPPFNILMC